MDNTLAFYENFDEDPSKKSDEQLIDEVIYVHDYKRYSDARIAVYSGKRIIVLKSRNYGKLEALYEKIGISRQTADNYVIIAKTYGKNPELLEGMTQRKAILLAKQVGEDQDIVKFIADELWRDPKGGLRTTVEVREMLIKDEENKHIAKMNTKNEELRKLISKNETMEAEIDAIREDDKEREKILNESLTGETKTLYEKTKALEEKLARKDKQINDLELELDEIHEGMYDFEEVKEAAHVCWIAIQDVAQKYYKTAPMHKEKARHEIKILLAEMDEFNTRCLNKDVEDQEEIKNDNAQ